MHKAHLYLGFAMNELLNDRSNERTRTIELTKERTNVLSLLLGIQLRVFHMYLVVQGF